MERCILHLDMDAFFAAIEQAANPALRGRPVIVGGRRNRDRTVVCAASYEAKRRGIDSGMSCRDAFKLCPQAAFVVANSAKYIYVSREINRLLQHYSPQVEQASVDEFYLDITGCERLFGSSERLARQLKQEIVRRFSITGSVGISINRLISKIASKLEKPDGLVVLHKADISKRLAALAVENITGIGRSLSQQLHSLGIFTFEDLRQVPPGFLQQQFGKTGLWMYAATHPDEDSKAVPCYIEEEEPPKSVGHSYTLPRNVYQPQEVRAWICMLCEMVGARLRRLGLESSVLHLYVRSSDMSFVGRQRNFKVPSSDSRCLYERALHIFELLRYRAAVRALGVTASGLSPQVSGRLLPEEARHASLLEAQDAINQRYGDWTVYPASILGIK